MLYLQKQMLSLYPKYLCDLKPLYHLPFMKNTTRTALAFCLTFLSTNILYAGDIGQNEDETTKTIVFRYDDSGNRIARSSGSNAKQGSRAKSKVFSGADITKNAGKEDSYTIRLERSAVLHDCTLNIYDHSGRLLAGKALKEPANELSMEGFRPGIYIIEVITDKGTYSTKIIKR